MAPGYSYTVIVPQRLATKLFLIKRGDTWALPGWDGHDEPRPYWQDVRAITRGLQEHYNLAATTLRCLGVTFVPSIPHTEYAYLVVPPPERWVPPSCGTWVAVEDLDRLSFAKPAHRHVIRLWLAGCESPGGPPWYSPDWFGRATAWIDEQLARLGRTKSGPIEQLRSWERACLLRIPTTVGWVYFKAVPWYFAHEVALIAALADWHCAGVLRPLAFDRELRWWLVDDFCGTGLDVVTDLARWEAAIVGYAALQVKSIARHDELLALGCSVAEVERLPAGLLALIADDKALMRGDAAGLTTTEIAHLHDLAPQIAQMCSQLDLCGIPAALEHGDLWTSNIIARHDGGYCYFDWSDSTVAHPFFSMFLFLESAEAAFPGDTIMPAFLRDSYLEVWSPFMNPRQAREAFDLAQCLAPLHHAMNYHQRILPAMWQRWEMARMVPFYLRRFLAGWDRA